MNIKKFNENTDNITDMVKLLGDKLANKFFNEMDEFNGVIVSKDYVVYNFEFYFDILYKETIEAISELDKYMGYGNLQIETKISEEDMNPVMYYWFNLDGYKIDEYLKKLQMEEEAEKYNL